MKGYSSLILIAVVLCQAACIHGSRTELVLVVDYSGSTRAERAQQQAVVVSRLESADPSTTFSLYRMGSTTEELLAGEIDSTPIEAIVSRLKRGTDSSDKRRGTNFVDMAEAVSARLSATTADRVQVTVMTDGGDDSASNTPTISRYTKSIDRICKDRRVTSVDFVGVLPKYKKSIRDSWAAAGNRLRLLEPVQASDK
ncbi:MAG: VWA domain-containing protein [Armatimonadetes bacterium]|nr:VWA domain-containing protein [Armatimonadota bacterium]